MTTKTNMGFRENMHGQISQKELMLLKKKKKKQKKNTFINSEKLKKGKKNNYGTDMGPGGPY